MSPYHFWEPPSVVQAVKTENSPKKDGLPKVKTENASLQQRLDVEAEVPKTGTVTASVTGDVAASDIQTYAKFFGEEDGASPEEDGFS